MKGNREKQIINISILGIIANLILAGVKIIIGVMSGSIAITSDAVNNLTDSSTALITIIGTKLAQKKPDKNHPFGFGRGGTETSKYPEEKKETSISKVAASEMERAQTVVRAPRGCGLHKVLESIAEQFWEI